MANKASFFQSNTTSRMHCFVGVLRNQLFTEAEVVARGNQTEPSNGNDAGSTEAIHLQERCLPETGDKI